MRGLDRLLAAVGVPRTPRCDGCGETMEVVADELRPGFVVRFEVMYRCPGCGATATRSWVPNPLE
jgi:hypothetical protein